MATTEFIAAIELGSSKITGVAGRKNSDGSMQILAYAQEDSSTFIRKGVIFNLDKTAQSLTSIINRLEGELKNSIAKVYVGIGGQSLRTVRNVVSRDLEEEAIISEELVNAIGDENVAIPVVDMDILDVAPQEYKVGNNLQANPVGLVGSHIEGRFLNIVARSSVRKNLEHCFQQAKIDIADQLIAPLVTANAVLTESERRSGCALIDFGADTTTISVYKNNILRFLTVLPLGGNSITRDITTLQMEEEEAERLKKAYGDAFYEEEEDQEEEEEPIQEELNFPESIVGKNGQFYRGTLRSGQKIEVEGSIVVLGDINPGAQIVAGGNVVVLGCLKGTVYAGYPQDRGAFVASLMMEPMQIQIGDCIARSPDQKAKKQKTGRKKNQKQLEAKLAFVENDSIFIETITRSLISEISIS